MNLEPHLSLSEREKNIEIRTNFLGHFQNPFPEMRDFAKTKSKIFPTLLFAIKSWHVRIIRMYKRKKLMQKVASW